MHSHEMKEHVSVRHLSHLNFLFSGRGSRVYDRTMVRLTRRLYQRVIEDMVPLRLVEGKVLDAGTGPGTLARDIARRFPQLQVYGIDLSADMIRLAHEHAKREGVEERVHFDVGDVGHGHEDVTVAREVASGFECGIVLTNFQDIKEGDVLEIFETRQVERELA